MLQGQGVNVAKQITFQSLTLKDSRELALRGFLQDSQAGVRRTLRSWFTATPSGVFLKCVKAEKILCLICLFRVPASGSGRLLLYWPQEIAVTARYALLETVLPLLLPQLFFVYDLQRVEWLVPVDEESLTDLAESSGLVREGLLKQSLPFKQSYKDGILFGGIRAENLWRNNGFVNFGEFLVYVTGEESLIHRVGVLSPGKKIESAFLRECAQYQGLADAEGKISIPHDLPTGWTSQVQLPAEVELCCAQLSEYAVGKRRTFSGIHLNQDIGTDFQWSVWQALKSIPFGEVRTYGEVAALVAASEGAKDLKAAQHKARAVGAACGANPFMLLVPCHRVIGKNGKLTGFRGGLEVKATLLDFELMGLRPNP